MSTDAPDWVDSYPEKECYEICDGGYCNCDYLMRQECNKKEEGKIIAREKERMASILSILDEEVKNFYKNVIGDINE